MSLLQFVQPTKVINVYSTITTCIKVDNYVLLFYLVNPKLKHQIWLQRSFESHLHHLNIIKMLSFSYYALFLLLNVPKQKSEKKVKGKARGSRRYIIPKIKLMTHCRANHPEPLIPHRATAAQIQRFSCLRMISFCLQGTDRGMGQS